ncbi:MAG: PilZ domain-containing protein [Deltaproteobacteria bacterium]|nr:PilZ domain-containing protein [Deltaproteobacteria bacterium]
MARIGVFHPAVGTFGVSLGSKGLVIGRQGGNVDIEVTWDALVSRRHGEFYESDGIVWFRDLGSKNGSYIDGERVSDARVAPGESVILGDTLFTVLPELPSFSFDDVTPTGAHLAASSADLMAQGLAEELPDAPDLPPSIGDPAKSTIDLGLYDDSADIPILEPVDFEPSRPPAKPSSVEREHPRYVPPGRVTLTLHDKKELRRVWLEDISKGGMFAVTDHPPPLGTVIDVVLEVAGEELTLRARVVHAMEVAVAARLGHPAGIGLEFIDLDDQKRSAIGQFVDGIAARLRTRDLPVMTATALFEVLKTAKDFLSGCDENQLYAAIGVPATSNDEAIVVRLAELKRMFGTPPSDANPTQAAKIATAAKALQRVTALFQDPVRRLDYDFRQGFVRSRERLEAAASGRGPSVRILREAWSHAFPKRAEMAEAKSHDAYRARQRNDFFTAVAAAKMSLEADPFNEDLRLSMTAWEATRARLSGRGSGE